MYEDLRRQNLIWTLAENYTIPPMEQIFETTGDFNQDFYPNAMEGFISVFFNRSLLQDYFQREINSLNNKKDLYKVTELVLEHHLHIHLLPHRLGVWKKRDQWQKQRLAIYQRFGRKTFSEELEYGYVSLGQGLVPSTSPLHLRLLHDIQSLGFPSNTTELIQQLRGLFKEYFHQNLSLLTDSVKNSEAKKIEDNPQKTKSIKSRKKNRTVVSSHEDDLEKYLIESAEFTANLFKDMKELSTEEDPTLQIEKKQDNSTQVKIAQHFGKNILPLMERNRLEQSICTGIHEGIRIHATKGQFEKDIVSRYYEDEVIMQKSDNLLAWDSDVTTYRRNIIQLKEILKKSILQDLEDEVLFSHSGTIVPTRIWKQLYTNDGKVFKREYQNDYGSLSVDILLDASGSQEERQSMVAIQAYIIAEALTELNIPTRVLGFHNLFNFLVIENFRDYNDPSSKNHEIFSYHSSGSNRDGLALRYVTETMRQTSDKKILIVLSDGKPNDKVNIGSVGSFGVNGINYEGKDAVLDTAKEILQCKMKGIHVLGVFTGDEKDLENQQLIFGNDFAYITDSSRFSAIVGMFLKTLIDKNM